jgi:hypothetical protein
VRGSTDGKDFGRIQSNLTAYSSLIERNCSHSKPRLPQMQTREITTRLKAVQNIWIRIQEITIKASQSSEDRDGADGRYSVRKKCGGVRCDHRFTDAAENRKLALTKHILDSITYSSEYFRFLVWFIITPVLKTSRAQNVSSKTS